jgi:hypothetical protein
LRERIALFTLSYEQLPGCYSRGQEFRKTSENAGGLPTNIGEAYPASWKGGERPGVEDAVVGHRMCLGDNGP